jgi:hypothetical protein
MAREAHVHAATIGLVADADPAAVGAAVTTELCGHWEHDGPCRWPHHNGIRATDDEYELRVVFVAPDAEVAEVHTRIASALVAMPGCVVVSDAPDALRVDEVALGARLVRPVER